MTRPTVVYVSGPLTTGIVTANIKRAIDVGNILIERGYVVHVPHEKALGMELLHPRTYREWMDYDLQVILTCDVVLRLDGKSDGADEEVAFAKQHGIPVFYSLDTLCAANACAPFLARTVNQAAGLINEIVGENEQAQQYHGTEQEVVLDVFYDLLKLVTGDGAKKRARGEKPPWWRDGAHRAAIFSHLNKYEHGERIDKDSGTHPYVHLAWRALAIAWQDLHGLVDPSAPLARTETNHRPGIDAFDCNECTCGAPTHPCNMVGCPHCWDERAHDAIHQALASIPNDDDHKPIVPRV